MATFKSYTDLDQSLNLAEFLPLESADMCWTNHCYGVMRSSMTISAKTVDEYKSLLDRFNASTSIDVFYPAWSLAALMDVLERGAVFKTPKGWACQTYIEYKAITSDYYSNPVDACYEMIIKLHEQKLL